MSACKSQIPVVATLAFVVAGLLALAAWVLLPQAPHNGAAPSHGHVESTDSRPAPAASTHTRKRAIHLPNLRRFWVSYYICRRSQLEAEAGELFPEARRALRRDDDPLKNLQEGTVYLEDDEFLVVKTHDHGSYGTLDSHLYQIGQEIPEAEGVILTSSPFLTRNALLHLHGWSNLRYLQLQVEMTDYRGMMEDDFELLGGIDSLTHLSFRSSDSSAKVRLSKKSMLGIARLTRLESLYCVKAVTDAEVAAAFSTFARMRRLILLPMMDPDAWFGTFGKLLRLERLECQGMRLRDVHVASLAGLHNLRYVSLGYCTLLTDASLLSLARCSKLERVELNGGFNVSISLQGIALLSRLPLDAFLLDGAFISLSNGLLGVVAGMKRLRILRFPYTPAFTGRGLGLVASLPRLEELDLDACSRMRQHHLRALVKVSRPLRVSVPRHVWGSLREELATANPNLTFNR